MKKVTLSNEDIENLKILFAFLSSSLSKEDLSLVGSGEYPARLKTLVSIIQQVDPGYLKKFKIEED